MAFIYAIDTTRVNVWHENLFKEMIHHVKGSRTFSEMPSSPSCMKRIVKSGCVNQWLLGSILFLHIIPTYLRERTQPASSFRVTLMVSTGYEFLSHD